MVIIMGHIYNMCALALPLLLLMPILKKILDRALLGVVN